MFAYYYHAPNTTPVVHHNTLGTSGSNTSSLSIESVCKHSTDSINNGAFALAATSGDVFFFLFFSAAVLLISVV
jgi:hypothetical protein